MPKKRSGSPKQREEPPGKKVACPPSGEAPSPPPEEAQAEELEEEIELVLGGRHGSKDRGVEFHIRWAASPEITDWWQRLQDYEFDMGDYHAKRVLVIANGLPTYGVLHQNLAERGLQGNMLCARGQPHTVDLAACTIDGQACSWSINDAAQYRGARTDYRFVQHPDVATIAQQYSVSEWPSASDALRLFQSFQGRVPSYYVPADFALQRCTLRCTQSMSQRPTASQE